MTLKEFTHRVETDAAYREHIRSGVASGTIATEEELLLFECALGPPHRRWANTERTAPWPTVLLQLYLEQR